MSESQVALTPAFILTITVVTALISISAMTVVRALISTCAIAEQIATIAANKSQVRPCDWPEYMHHNNTMGVFPRGLRPRVRGQAPPVPPALESFMRSKATIIPAIKFIINHVILFVSIHAFHLQA